jgi:single-stranded DNA-specific DHH superfamily exonuclease
MVNIESDDEMEEVEDKNVEGLQQDAMNFLEKSRWSEGWTMILAFVLAQATKKARIVHSLEDEVESLKATADSQRKELAECKAAEQRSKIDMVDMAESGAK